MLTIERIRETLQAEKPRFHELGITRVGIFGSWIRGEATADSDVDILIEASPEDSSLTLFSLAGLELELEEKLHAPVDLVLRSGLKAHIGERILSEVQYV